MMAALEAGRSDPGSDPADWPSGWWDLFDATKADYARVGYSPGDAARLAHEHLEALSRHRWRLVLAEWTAERREAWGRRANALEDEGLGWREAEKLAFDELA